MHSSEDVLKILLVITNNERIIRSLTDNGLLVKPNNNPASIGSILYNNLDQLEKLLCSVLHVNDEEKLFKIIADNVGAALEQGNSIEAAEFLLEKIGYIEL